MQALELNVNWQLRLVYLGATVTSAVNFCVVWLLGLPYLPQFYLCATLIAFLLFRRITMKWFLPAYLLRFFLVACQSFLSVYVIGDDCGIFQGLSARIYGRSMHRMCPMLPHL